MNHTLVRCCAALLLLALGLFWHKPAEAALSCTVAGPSTINFSVDPLSTQTDVSGNLTVTCNNPGFIPASARICFTVADAISYMKQGGNQLAYELFQDSAYSVPWSNLWAGNPQPTVTLLGSFWGDGSRQILVPFNARVLGGQNPVPGTYTENYPPGQTQMTVNVADASLQAPATCSTKSPQHFGFTAIATVVPQCSVTATTLDFGTPTGVLTSAVAGTSVIGVQCPVSTSYNVGLDGGSNSGNNINARRMILGSNSVAYQLYRDSSRTQVWGDTVGTDTVAGTGDGTVQNLTVYGQVPAQPTPPAGTYQDTVVVSVTY